jgi:hypothetical protein
MPVLRIIIDKTAIIDREPKTEPSQGVVDLFPTGTDKGR